MRDLIPQWTTASWNAIVNAPWERGGWIVGGVVQPLVVRAGNVWGEEPDPGPSPDPDGMVRMAREEWAKIAGGVLQRDLVTIKSGDKSYKVIARTLDGGERLAVVQAA